MVGHTVKSRLYARINHGRVFCERGICSFANLLMILMLVLIDERLILSRQRFQGGQNIHVALMSVVILPALLLVEQEKAGFYLSC